MNKVEFIFNEEWKNECCVKFMFIIPKYRRKGNFTKLLNKIMEKNIFQVNHIQN